MGSFYIILSTLPFYGFLSDKPAIHTPKNEIVRLGAFLRGIINKTKKTDLDALSRGARVLKEGEEAVADLVLFLKLGKIMELSIMYLRLDV